MKLSDLLEAARNRFPTPKEILDHRKSFAYGNAAIENPLITKEMFDRPRTRGQSE